MILYGAIILVCMALIAVFSALFGGPALGFGAGYAVICTVLSTAAVIALDGLFAFLLRRLPEKWFMYTRRFFTVSAREARFYEKLGIRKWKNKIPELGGFTHFHKNKIADPRNPAYLTRYLLEADYGMAIHLCTAVTGCLIVFLCPLRYALCFGVPVGFVNAVLNLLPFFTLRYNAFKLRRVLNRVLHAQQS